MTFPKRNLPVPCIPRFCSRGDRLAWACCVVFSTFGVANAKDYEAQIADLSSEIYQIRASATNSLSEVSDEEVEHVKKLCYDIYLDAPDPETSARCCRVVANLVRRELVKPYSYIGATIQFDTFLNRKNEPVVGLRVDTVVDESPAKLAGLEPNDLIYQINGEVFEKPTPELFIGIIRKLPPKSKVTLTILRNRIPRELEIVTAAGKPNAEEIERIKQLSDLTIVNQWLQKQKP